MPKIKLILILTVVLGMAYSISLDRNKEYLIIGQGEFNLSTIKHRSSNNWNFYRDGAYYDYWSLSKLGKLNKEMLKDELYSTTQGYFLISNDLSNSVNLENINFEDFDNFKYPPDLVMDNIKFVKDPKFNTYERPPENLYGGEYGTIEFDITNSGRGTANLIIIEMDGSVKGGHLIVNLEGVASSHDGGEFTEHISIPISAPLSTVDMMYNFTINATEYNGFDAESITFNLQILAVPQPKFQLENLTWDDDKKRDSWGNGDGIINKGEAIEAVATIKNIGNGSASDVNFKISMDDKPDGFFLNEDQILSFYTDGLMPNEIMEIPFYFVTNKKIEADSFIINLNVTEESGEFGNSFELDFYINQQWAFDKNTDQLEQFYSWEYSCGCNSWDCSSEQNLYFDKSNRTYSNHKNPERGTDNGSYTIRGSRITMKHQNGKFYIGKIKPNGTILFNDEKLQSSYCWKMTPN